MVRSVVMGDEVYGCEVVIWELMGEVVNVEKVEGMVEIEWDVVGRV